VIEVAKRRHIRQKTILEKEEGRLVFTGPFKNPTAL
jgi:hypothetical protein